MDMEFYKKWNGEREPIFGERKSAEWWKTFIEGTCAEAFPKL